MWEKAGTPGKQLMGENYMLEPHKGRWALQAGAMKHEWVDGLVVVPGKQLLQAHATEPGQMPWPGTKKQA